MRVQPISGFWWQIVCSSWFQSRFQFPTMLRTLSNSLLQLWTRTPSPYRLPRVPDKAQTLLATKTSSTNPIPFRCQIRNSTKSCQGSGVVVWKTVGHVKMNQKKGSPLGGRSVSSKWALKKKRTNSQLKQSLDESDSLLFLLLLLSCFRVISLIFDVPRFTELRQSYVDKTRWAIYVCSCCCFLFLFLVFPALLLWGVNVPCQWRIYIPSS